MAGLHPAAKVEDGSRETRLFRNGRISVMQEPQNKASNRDSMPTIATGEDGK
jgi:hypothetical protein